MSNKVDNNVLKIERGKRLNYIRSMVGMIGEKFASFCNISRTTLVRWEHGQDNGLTEKGAQKIVKAIQSEGIDCAVIWLLHGIGMSPRIVNQNRLSRFSYTKRNDLNILNVVNETTVIETEDENCNKEIQFFKHCYPNHLIFQLSDDSMFPIYQNGDFLGGIQLSAHQLSLANNKICIVLLRSNSYLIRKIKIFNDMHHKIGIYPINIEVVLEYNPILQLFAQDILALAPVTRLWRNFYQ